jgi:large subunit ribosomal protein L3
MLQGLIGIKTYQLQSFLQNGTRIPLSGVSVLENYVSQIKTADKEGYDSIQIGLGTKKNANQSLTGHSKKAGLEKTPRFLKEVRVDDASALTPGAKIDINDVLKPVDIVNVTGVSKGKGWAGGVKRWGFHGGPRTHGQSDRERAPGSIGQTTTPGRVYKGKKMAGKMGDTTATVRNLEVIEITADGVILIKGLIPGSKGTLVVIKKVGENKKFVPLYKEESVEEPIAEKLSEAQEGKPAAVKEQADIPDVQKVEEKAEEAQEEAKQEVIENANG